MNNLNMVQQFEQFKESMKGKDPNKVLNDMLASGKVTKQQVEQAQMMAQAFKSLLK